MTIKRKLWYAKVEGLTYLVVAKSFDEAVQLIKIWRPGDYIEEVRLSSSDSIVIVKEDMDEVIKKGKGMKLIKPSYEIWQQPCGLEGVYK